MSLVDRAKNIITTPRTEWPIAAAEPATIGGLFTGYAIPLALLPVIGGILGLFTKGLGFSGFMLVTLLVGYLIGLGMLYLMAIVADALAPSFDGRRSQVQAAKLVIYSATPMWVTGFIGGLLPLALAPLALLLSLAGFGWAAYLIYLGSSYAMGVPQAKAIGYAAVLIILWVVISMVLSGIIVGAVVAAFIGSGGLTGVAPGL